MITGSKNHEQGANFRVKLHKKSVIDTGGLPHEITSVKGMFYLITNIDVPIRWPYIMVQMEI